MSTEQKNVNPKQVLMDLAKELDGETIEHTCNVKGFEFKMRLLNEEESNWRNGYINLGSKLSAVSSWRLPTLAIGIRQINGTPVFEFFREEWDATEESRRALEIVEGKGPYSAKYFTAEHLMKFLADRFPEVISDLWDEWQRMEDRRSNAQDALKKSSGESSDEGIDPSGTELSPSGEK